MKITVERKEVDAILAGLRLLADAIRDSTEPNDIGEIRCDSGHGLSADECDDLATSINVGERD